MFYELKKRGHIRLDMHEDLIFKLNNLINAIKNKDKIPTHFIDLSDDNVIDLVEEEELNFTSYDDIVHNLNILIADKI